MEPTVPNVEPANFASTFTPPMIDRRVLHILTRFKKGGTERDVQDLVAWEIANGFEVHVAVGNDSDVTDAAFPGAEIHHIESLVRNIEPLSDRASVFSLRRLTKSRAITVIHTHQAKAGILGRSAAVGLPVRVAHWVHGPSFGAGFSSLGSTIYRACERLADFKTTAWVFVGDELRSRYVAAGVCSSSKTIVARSPIDVDRYLALRDSSAARQARARAALELGTEVPVVANVGAMEWRKRQDLFLEAISLVPDKPVAVLAGDGPQRSSLERQARDLDITQNARFLGHVDELTDLFTVASVLVHTSAREGASQVILQALAAGLPVVATPACGLREVRGAHVKIVPADARALAIALREAMRNGGSPPDPKNFRPWSLRSRHDSYNRLYHILSCS